MRAAVEASSTVGAGAATMQRGAHFSVPLALTNMNQDWGGVRESSARAGQGGTRTSLGAPSCNWRAARESRRKVEPFGQEETIAGHRRPAEVTADTWVDRRAALPAGALAWASLDGEAVGALLLIRRRTKNKRPPGSTARTSLVTRCKGDRGMARESPPRMSVRINTPSPLGCRATPAVTDNGTWKVRERAAKTRRARRWENRARHPWRYSRLTNRCS